MSVHAEIAPYILSGGAGSRLWPLSEPDMPKQFLKLTGPHSLLQQTALRLAHPAFLPPVMVGNRAHRVQMAEQLHEVDIRPGGLVLEPVMRDTAPAAITAALLCAEEQPDALVLLAPSDHAMLKPEAFVDAVLAGVAAARTGQIVTFGVRPDHAATQYGYIEAGPTAGAASGDVLSVVRFVEKPDLPAAKDYLRSGRFYWNAGIFLFAPQTLIRAYEALAPDLLACCRRALDAATTADGCVRLDAAAFSACRAISLDYAIMEKAGNVACVPFDAGWTDLGTWPAVKDALPADAEGNVIVGQAVLQECRNSLVYSPEGSSVAIAGLDNVIAIMSGDKVLICASDKAPQIREMARNMPARGPARRAAEQVLRPWGSYRVLDEGDGFRVKALIVRPGGQTSLQSHRHRAEQWTVVSGAVDVQRGSEHAVLGPAQSIFIPQGQQHRLSNSGQVPAMLIEVQTGSYLGDDDIVRHDDRYGRRTPMQDTA